MQTTMTISSHKGKQARSKVLVKTFKERLVRQINTRILIIELFIDKAHSLLCAQLNICNSHRIHRDHNSYINTLNISPVSCI